MLMRTFIAMTVLLLATAVNFAQTRPKFSDYPVRKVFKGKLARVNLRSAPGAALFRTRLREAAAAGPNFAGHYAIGLWGCGSPCLMAGMADLHTGNVVWPPNPQMMVFDISCRKDSRLFVINSQDVLGKVQAPRWIGSEWPEELFFVWNGKRFVRVREKH